MARVTDINLLPWREERRNERNKRFLRYCAYAVAIAAGLSYLMVVHWNGKIEHQSARNDFMKKEITQLDDVIQEINDLKDKRLSIVDRIEVIQELQANRTQIVHIFDDLVKKMPSGVYLDKISKQDEKIAMSGRAQSNGRVSDLMRNLDSSDWFENASLNVVDLDDSDTVAVSKFDLKVAESARGNSDEENLSEVK